MCKGSTQHFGCCSSRSNRDGATNILNMNKYNWDKELIEEAVRVSNNYREVLRYLNIPISGNNSSTLKRKIKEYQINTSHFTFHSTTAKKKKEINDYLVKGNYIPTSKLKAKLFSSGLKQNVCEICGVNSWLGKKLVCQLHHLNGDNSDNRLENLQILCPNCHSQTDNFCGQANSEERAKRFCADCGRELKSDSSIYCLSCASKRRKKVNITKEQLLTILRETGNRVQAAKKIGVSEACIRKWCKKFDLPTKSKDLNKLF